MGLRTTVEEMLMFALCGLIMVVSTTEEEVGSPLRVAQCRARCIQRFTMNFKEEHGTCLQGPDCYMCWENCQLLQSNFAVWGAICDEKGICFPGCKEACQFHSEAESQRVPVIQTRGEDVVEAGGGVASWPKGPGGPFVYVVMRRGGPGGPWRQITQTEGHSARVPDGGVLRVLAVNHKGLATIYSPASGLARAKQVLASLGSPLLPLLRPTSQPPKRINTEIQPSTPFSLMGEEKEQIGRTWELHEDSLIHQKVLVIAEISWERRTIGHPESRSVYFVTWEVDGGGLKGNLFTDSTSVTLSLWPDTVYHIQVELVGPSEKSSLKSEVLVVDTSRAVGVEMPEPPRRVPAPHSSPAPPELALGFAAALALFALILVLVLAIKRRQPSQHHKLVDPPNLTRIFPPIVSIVRENPPSPNRTCPRTLHV